MCFEDSFRAKSVVWILDHDDGNALPKREVVGVSHDTWEQAQQRSRWSALLVAMIHLFVDCPYFQPKVLNSNLTKRA